MRVSYLLYLFLRLIRSGRLAVCLSVCLFTCLSINQSISLSFYPVLSCPILSLLARLITILCGMIKSYSPIPSYPILSYFPKPREGEPEGDRNRERESSEIPISQGRGVGVTEDTQASKQVKAKEICNPKR